MDEHGLKPKIKTTAELVCFARAAGALETDPGVRNPDHLARDLIRWRFRLVLLPGVRALAEKLYDLLVPGMYLYHQARTRHLDGIVVRELADRVPQFVILGAGLDSRAYRFRPQLGSTRVFEVDHPATAAWKQERLNRWGGDYRHVTFISVDFTVDSLAQRLTAAGWDPHRRTLFLLEGVSYYLTEAALRQTMTVLGTAAADSGLAFDFFDRRALDDPAGFFGAREFIPYAARKGEPILFGIAPAAVVPFLREYGFAPVSITLSNGLQQHLRLADGSLRGRICEFFGIVHARRIPHPPMSMHR